MKILGTANPFLAQQPVVEILQKQVVVLEIDIQSGDDGDVRLKLYIKRENEEECYLDERSFNIPYLQQKIHALETYYTQASSMIGSEEVNLELIVDYTKSEVLNLITCNQNFEKLWEKFIQYTHLDETQMGLVIGLNVAAECSFLLEHLKMKRREAEEKIWVIKSYRPECIWDNLYQVLPTRIVLLLGEDVSNEDPLDIDGECRKIYEAFGKGYEFQEGQIAYAGGEIEAIVDGQAIKLQIISQHDSVEDIQQELESIEEPYLLIYSGHGVLTNTSKYLNGYFDGRIGKKYLGESTMTHEQFKEIIASNLPWGIVFNCCNAIRGMKPFEGESVAENSFKECYVSEKTIFISGTRTKVTDHFATLTTQSIVEAFLERKDLIGMIKKLLQKRKIYNVQMQEEDVSYLNRIIRDHISEVFLMN